MSAQVMKLLRQTVGVTCFLLTVSCSSHRDLVKGTPSKQEITRIANREATRLGYDIRHMTISIDEQNSQWNHYLAAFNILNVDADLARSLSKKEYWAVYYAPVAEPGFVIVGGDLLVFVDKVTGRILTYRLGQ